MLAVAGAALPPRVRPVSRWLRMSSSDQEVSTGGTGTGVQTIIKEVIKEMTVVRNACGGFFIVGGGGGGDSFDGHNTVVCRLQLYSAKPLWASEGEGDGYNDGHCVIGGCYRLVSRFQHQGGVRHGHSAILYVLLGTPAARRWLITPMVVFVLVAIQGSQIDQPC